MIRHELETLFQPVITELGYELWGCDYIAQGKHSLLRVYIDKKDGIGIADCEQVSRQVSALLDVDDPIQGNYTLEVSSPGIPRPLFHSWQYERYIGLSVQLKLMKPIDGQRSYLGVIAAVNETAVLLTIDNEAREFLFSTIVKAHLMVE